MSPSCQTLSNDARNYQCSLNHISCFPFENYLQVVKKTIRNSNNPTVQIAKRLLMKEKRLNMQSMKTRLKVSDSKRDRCFIINDKLFGIVTSIDENTVECDTVKIERLEPFFVIPFDSKVLDTLFVPSNVKYKSRTFSRVSMTKKCICLPFRNGHVIFPLVHTES